MANIKQQILDNIVKPALSNLVTSTNGNIIKVDKKNMLADVVINKPQGEGTVKLFNVPIQVSGGISISGPYEGDKVIINFQNGNVFNPIITSIIDNNFDNNTRNDKQRHTRKGVFVPDLMSERIDWGMKSAIWS